MSSIPATPQEPENASTSEKVEATRQITLSFPEGKTPPGDQPDAGAILAALRTARRATAKRKRAQAPRRPDRVDFEYSRAQSRRAERVPARALVRDYKRTRGRSTGDGWHRAASHLRTITFRALNDLQPQYTAVDVETFADAIDNYVWQDLKALTRYQAPGDPSPTRFEKWALMDDDGVDRLVINVVNNALEAWDHAWIERRREEGSKGGARSRRAPQWAEADLDRLRPAGDLYGLTVDQQARALGWSRSTVDRMRAELRNLGSAHRNVMIGGDLLDLLDGL